MEKSKKKTSKSIEIQAFSVVLQSFSEKNQKKIGIK